MRLIDAETLKNAIRERPNKLIAKDGVIKIIDSLPEYIRDTEKDHIVQSSGQKYQKNNDK